MRSRRVSSIEGGPVGGPAGGERRRHRRMKKTTRPMPRRRAAKGTIQATMSKPPRSGAARTVGPYLATNQLKTPASGRPVAISVRSSVISRSESGQPTWLHSRRIWPQPQTHMSLWPMASKREEGAPAPSIGMARTQTSAMWRRRLCIRGLCCGESPRVRVETRGTRFIGLEGFGAASGGLEGWDECNAGAEDDDADADPDPVHERVEKDLDDGLVGLGVAAFEDDVNVTGKCLVDGHHGRGLLAGVVEAALRCKLRDLFAVVEEVEESVVGVVVGVRVLRIRLADELVRTDLQRVAEGHFQLFTLVEGGASDANEEDHDAEGDDVSAVTARVAAREQDCGTEEVFPGPGSNAAISDAALGADDVRPAKELADDGGDDAGGEREADQRVDGAGGTVRFVPGAEAGDHQNDGADDDGEAGNQEVAADGADGCSAPGEKRADSGEEDEEEADGDGDAVVERRAHCDLGALHVLAEHREECAPEDGEAGSEEDEIVEEERGLA